ncbi:hypothetical protein M427DRAFT_269430 [Gonapodya prolifera JEL478]|uniref:Nudix hydrolase domain-containing protein n=1 Tax=Gonapodya prolifera (strain JEL478) TaxID=1344416 RepID=A0A139AJU5_GONPJ|nr:hypothetical protein M427DRAFT_269430 [Gonapodya prolifera JEL478]|eukprot:KXS17057.1 hypothetical protein M427DRAFT_269430 [Gonapodya prolifera JEL478]
MTQRFFKGSHCTFCGAPFTNRYARYPRDCACGSRSYVNPTTVVQAMVPILSDDDKPPIGLLVIKRGDGRWKGHWALPGGKLEIGETWQEGVVRELYEEAGLETSADEVSILDLRSAQMNPYTNHLVLFGLLKPRKLSDLPPFVPSRECTERKFLEQKHIKDIPYYEEREVIKAWFQTLNQPVAESL